MASITRRGPCVPPGPSRNTAGYLAEGPVTVCVSAGNCERIHTRSNGRFAAVEVVCEMVWSAVGMADIVIQGFVRLAFVLAAVGVIRRDGGLYHREHRGTQGVNHHRGKQGLKLRRRKCFTGEGFPWRTDNPTVAECQATRSGGLGFLLLPLPEALLAESTRIRGARAVSCTRLSVALGSPPAITDPAAKAKRKASA